ncbi:hypothetical protein GCM10010965_22290 [Caldalkalibacillus thermarum]|uniref:hypothetical protein n=1 Tax=Caldalkalibacillus thermarum TaxID=296745 RepID=UPI0016640368|nr:hypothetical protein [Caldalkalibacillus thermarum]GGK28993.1 hypothetical protein GCM10010965_22290 [Caldalkalibacillus thermarum]
MALVFNPWKNHGLPDEQVRLVIKDFDSKAFYKIEIIHKADGDYVLTDKKIETNKWRFKYKYQVKQEKWVDVTPYMEMITEKEKHEFEHVLLDRAALKQEEVPGFIARWENDAEACLKVMGKAAYKFIRKLWTDPSFSPQNVPAIVQYVKEKKGFTASFSGNLFFYFSIYLELKALFERQQLQHHSYADWLETINTDRAVADAIKKLIKQCEDFASSLQLATVLKAKLESLLGNRKKAAATFHQAALFEPDYLKYLHFDQGVYTYSDFQVRQPWASKVIILIDRLKKSNKPNNLEAAKDRVTFVGQPPAGGHDDLIILISLDEKFMRCYGSQLMFYVNVLKQYQFHFHLVGDIPQAEKVIQETESLFHSIHRYRGTLSAVKKPSFSMERVPEHVQDQKTYYACSRYLIAEQIMDRFDTNLYIMDADIILLSDPAPYFQKLQQYDVAIPFSAGVVIACPWRRLMAGNVFIKNNPPGRQFLALVRQYIHEHTGKPAAWTLDQNALCYAFECMRNNQDILIGNCNQYVKPMEQGSIHKLIETL